MVRRAVNVLLLKSEMILLIFVSYLLGKKIIRTNKKAWRNRINTSNSADVALFTTYLKCIKIFFPPSLSTVSGWAGRQR